jgi:hypothetical protein
MEDTIANYAHEIGHAFGLMHEQQRADLWTRTYWGSGKTNKFIFNCDKLADYEEKVARLDEDKRDTVCKVRASAAVIKFSAMEFLPVATRTIYGGQSEDNPDMDTKSIMMYPSNAGGIGTGKDRAIVYTLQNGDTIGYNTQPSQIDIDTVSALEYLFPCCSQNSETCSSTKRNNFSLNWLIIPMETIR